MSSVQQVIECDGELRGCWMWPGGRVQHHVHGCPWYGKEPEHRSNRMAHTAGEVQGRALRARTGQSYVAEKVAEP